MKKSEYFLLVMIIICASCAKDQWFDPPDTLPGNSSQYNLFSPHIKIAVISDIHYLDPSIMPDDFINHEDFQKYVSRDRKLIELSDPIFRKAISDLTAEKPDILLITGDLTKDGELVSHETVTGLLHQLSQEGIKIYVVPGNNDINNPDAETYKTVPSSPVPSVSLTDFVSLYGEFGYDDALYRDLNSLSYISQPVEKLWILSVDANNYVSPGSRGEIKTSTMIWIREKMEEARENNITVLAMMHYGIIEHYSGQDNLEKLIRNSQANAVSLIEAGVRLIFTGHYHATDISEFTNEGNTLFDIQTGSLVTPPSPYRIMTLDDNFINIDTKHINGVESELMGDMDFLKYSDVTITGRTNSFFSFYLPLLFGYSVEQAEYAAPFLTNGYKAYFAGDEKISPAENVNIMVLEQDPYSPLLGIVKSFWKDLPPNDNQIHIRLK